MLTETVNHNHVITLNVNKDFLILECTCHLKTLSYHLQMAELSVNICKLYKNYMITDHTVQKQYHHWPYDIKDILVLCLFL